MTHSTFLDVHCPHCTYVGPAALVHKEGTDFVIEHCVAVCPWCARAWIVDTLLGVPLTKDDISRISSDGP